MTRSATAFEWRQPLLTLVPPSKVGHAIPAGWNGAAALEQGLEQGQEHGVVNPGEPGGPRPWTHEPPPPGCEERPESWCELASGGSGVFIDEDFDDGDSTARDWSATGLWHEVDFDTCPPGASTNPGRSWYFGVDSTCQYENNSAGVLTSPEAGPVTDSTLLTFTTRLGKESAPPSSGPDSACVLFNGVRYGCFNEPPPLNDAWYNVNDIPLNAWSGWPASPAPTTATTRWRCAAPRMAAARTLTPCSSSA